MAVGKIINGSSGDDPFEYRCLAASLFTNDHVAPERHYVKIRIVVLERLEEDIIVVSVSSTKVRNFSKGLHLLQDATASFD